MRFDLLKRYMPRSLYGRAALILLLPIVTLQIVISVSFIQRHYADVTRQMTRAVELELAYLVAEIADAPPAAAAERARDIGGALDLAVTIPAAEVPGADRLRAFDLSGRTMVEELRRDLPALLAADLTAPREVRVWIATALGPAEVTFARRRIAAANAHQLVVLIVVLGVILSLVSFLFLRNQLRPIRKLADAATDYGRGRITPYRPGGATEVRAAGTAFLDMRTRIERQSQARTMMLSGVSHDLRTPLTRLRLGLALVDEADTAGLTRDLDEMEAMLNGFLDFARGDGTEPTVPVDLPALIARIAEDARRGGQSLTVLPVEGADPGPVPLRPGAIRRAVENLLANARRHGRAATIGLGFGDRSLRIVVEDDGPGIPADRRDEAMRPFTRLDPARNQDAGAGVGLGLAIVSDIARAHGGSLRLGDSATLGGLRAEMILPL